jgi:hypothetical protein
VSFSPSIAESETGWPMVKSAALRERWSENAGKPQGSHGSLIL